MECNTQKRINTEKHLLSDSNDSTHKQTFCFLKVEEQS